ncbi:hypothetical protein Tco_0450582 [Tanacetum coccineum]
MNELHVRLNILRLTISPEACSFMLCDLDFEPLSLSLSSLPSCDLMSLTNMLILLHYLESFKSELAEFPVNYPPQETSNEILQARDDLMEAIQAFLKEYDHIPPNEKCMALLLAEERFLKIKQAME